MKLAFDSGYQQANMECLQLQIKVGGYIRQMESQLKYLGQINEDGSIRTPDNDDSKGFDD